MTKGIITIKINKETLENIILPKDEISSIAEAILSLNEWAIPHWDWIHTVNIGSVKVNANTVGYILDRLKELFPNHKQEVMMMWLNYGWSVRNDLEDWKIQINFSKIIYKEEITND